VRLGHATNNIAEYSAVIELLVDAISLGIRHLVVRLDSKLIVLQLSNVYTIRSPTLLRVYLQIRLLERYFDYIEYQHIPRCLNTLTDALANYVLDRHLNHLKINHINVHTTHDKPVEAVCIYITIKRVFYKKVCSKTKMSKTEAYSFYKVTSWMTFMVTHDCLSNPTK
jgi:ribonuclease HI